uniref:ATP synthase subunit a n=1 Tax=Anastatus dexingensis TaxID=2926466 RepID=A0A9E8Y9L0_9HYME|nr:ATP synthase F0 subunit 6 [Anastatus dexingensis]WAJ57478.1 ATP synthase F0 subunit 6 [Anastatus dexingensis]
MMMNLFSIFDPLTSMNFSLNWMSIMLVLFFIPMNFWFIPSRWSKLLILIFKKLIFEFSLLMNLKVNKMNILLFISLFLFIMLSNLLGMFPYIFTSTSHLIVSLSLSMFLWFSMMLYGWVLNLNHMFVHLVPQGTPFVLMFFMVLIETISNLIRPGTLAVRLSANMIAGHLLMSLISSSGMNLSILLLMVMILVQSMLIILELSVSFIQAYVFSILSSLYSIEMNYEKNISTFSFSYFKTLTYFNIF